MASPDRKARKKLQRRQEILEAAYTVFREVGYSAATVDLIAERADLAKGTIYIYFKSKEELYFSLLVNGLDILVELLRDLSTKDHPPETMLKETAGTLFQFYTEYTDYFRLFIVMQQEDMQNKLTPELAGELNARGTAILKLLSSQIQSLIGSGVATPVNPWNIANILWGAFNGITELAITREHLKVRNPNTEDLIYLFFEVIERGLASHPAKPRSKASNRQARP